MLRQKQIVLGLTLAAAALATGVMVAAAERPARILSVCADPDNMPFSNERGEGFEDKIAALIAADLHADLQMTWRSSRRGFLRRTVQSGACDLVMGVPAGFPSVASTQPYYRSAYVVVSAKSAHLKISSYDDPALRRLKIGLPALGAEGANTPPAAALAKRGVVGNIVGFPVFGDAAGQDPQAKIIDAVATGEIDAAIVWGPIGGYYARAYKNALVVAPAPVDAAHPEIAFAYDISLGLEKSQTALRAELDEILIRRSGEINAILNEFGVPIVGARAAEK